MTRKKPSPGLGFSLVLPWDEVMKDGVLGSAEPSCEQNGKPRRLLEMPSQSSWEWTDEQALEWPPFSLFNLISLLFAPLLISSAVPGGQTDPTQPSLNIEIPQNHPHPFNSVMLRTWPGAQDRVVPEWRDAVYMFTFVVSTFSSSSPNEHPEINLMCLYKKLLH